MDDMFWSDIYRAFHTKTKECTFFSAPHGPFSRIAHIMGYKTGLNIYKNIDIIPFILSDHNKLRLVFKNKTKRKPTYT